MSTFYLFFGKFISLFITLFTNKLLASFLAINEYGIFKLVFNILSILSFVSLPGASETISLVISKKLKGGKRIFIERTKIVVFLTIILSIIFFLLNINYQLIQNVNQYILVSLVILVIPFYLQYDVFSSALIACKDFKNYNYLLISHLIFFLIGIYISFFQGINKGILTGLIGILMGSIPIIFFNLRNFKNFSNGIIDKNVKEFSRKQNYTKFPQVLFNFDLIIFSMTSGTTTVGEIAVLNVIAIGLKSIFGIIQNRLSNYLYKTKIEELIKINNKKKIKLFILIYLCLSIILSSIIIPYIFKLIFDEQYFYIIPYVIIHSIFILITSPFGLLSIPLKIRLGYKDNFFINAFHPFLSFVLILLLSRYGLSGYLLTRIILMLTINIYYIKSFKKLTSSISKV